MPKYKREYRDPYYDIEEEYGALKNKYFYYVGGINPEFADKAIYELVNLIDREPNFLDPYLDIYYYLRDHSQLPVAELILNYAYDKAVSRISDKKGNWPDEMIYEARNNRHIIRVIIAKGELEWEKDRIIEAMDIFRWYLRTNPRDGLGVKYRILAIRMKWTSREYVDFISRDTSGDEIEDWFMENYQKFPDEFKEWERWNRKMGNL
jgi:hypothetical protein